MRPGPILMVADTGGDRRQQVRPSSGRRLARERQQRSPSDYPSTLRVLLARGLAQPRELAQAVNAGTPVASETVPDTEEPSRPREANDLGQHVAGGVASH